MSVNFSLWLQWSMILGHVPVTVNTVGFRSPTPAEIEYARRLA